ncbi:hypothetical protein [Cyclobacterium plantarum]|uniref:hypothetical protein n=1 Tax=Cyclobacterium plantarum TaxID=2716263 RepID=UPI003F70FABE
MRGSKKKYINQRQKNKNRNLIIIFVAVLGIFFTASIFFVRTGSKNLSDNQNLSLPELSEKKSQKFGLEDVAFLIGQYYSSLEKGTFNADDFFNPQVSQYITLKNTSPVLINENYIKDKQEYANPKFSIINNQIDFLRTHNDVDYYTYSIFYKCFRRSRGKFQECYIDVEIGINTNGKITSYKELKIRKLKFI